MNIPHDRQGAKQMPRVDGRVWCVGGVVGGKEEEWRKKGGACLVSGSRRFLSGGDARLPVWRVGCFLGVEGSAAYWRYPEKQNAFPVKPGNVNTAQTCP
ncbi:hypothetical protein E2C01_067431 [Portunus trituberculatus]|uniref:Uncharacterized protein n=1 Tax=Portunus trituberculatus TaxID=210409 RepID=A0A5B7HSL3_PORTR|nr:hypothetical protein [Portunus trituberculatus]